MLAKMSQRLGEMHTHLINHLRWLTIRIGVLLIYDETLPKGEHPPLNRYGFYGDLARRTWIVHDALRQENVVVDPSEIIGL